MSNKKKLKKNLKNVIASGLTNLVLKLSNVAKAPERISTLEWVQKYMYVPSVKSLGGKVDAWANPVLPLVLDLIDDPKYDKIAVMGGARIGKTTAMIAVMCKEITTTRRQIIDAWPDETKIKYQVRTDLWNVLQSSPIFESIVPDDKAYKKAGSIKMKHFSNGAKIIFANMQSSNDMAGVDGAIVIAHEIDRAPKVTGSDGDTMTQLEARTKAQFDPKIIIESTPTMEDYGIDMYYKRGTMHEPHFYFTCCNTYQKIEWSVINDAGEKSGVIWNTDKDDVYIKGSARYKCSGCGTEHDPIGLKAIIGQRDSDGKNGPKLIAKYPERTMASVHLGWLVMTVFGDLEKIVQDYHGKKDDPSQLQGFYNLTLGLPFRPAGSRLQEDELAAKVVPAEALVCPEGAVMLTAGVDKQKDYLAVQIVAWFSNYRRQVIYYSEIEGDTSTSEPWKKVFRLLDAPVKTKYYNKGVPVCIPIEAVFIDSGYDAHHVYNMVREANMNSPHGKKYFAIKGSKTFDAPILKKPTMVDVYLPGSNSKIQQGIPLYTLGVSMAKQRLYSEFTSSKLPTDRGYTTFGEFLPSSYYRMLASEELRVTYNDKGDSKYEWVKIHERNEALDTFIYAYAAYLYTAGMSEEHLNYKERLALLKSGKSIDGKEPEGVPIEIDKVEKAIHTIKNGRIAAVVRKSFYLVSEKRHVKPGEVVDITIEHFLEYKNSALVDSVDTNVKIEELNEYQRLATTEKPRNNEKQTSFVGYQVSDWVKGST